MALEDILAAIRVTAAGDALLAPSVTRRLIEQFSSGSAPASPLASSPSTPPSTSPSTLQGITGREREVLALVGQGLTNNEIADRLTITGATVKTYMTRLLTKLDARDRVQLVIIAYETGLVGTRRRPGCPPQ